MGGGGGGWVAGSIETKAISASNLKLKLKLTEAELGNIGHYPEGIRHWSDYVNYASEDVGHHVHKIIL